MNGTRNEKDKIPPTITVSPGDADDQDQNKQDGDGTGGLNEAELDELEFQKYHLRKNSSTKRASFFIGDEDQIPVTIVGPDNKEICPEDIVVAPDGGYGYVIVFAAFMTNFVVDGTIFSFGLILNEIVAKSNGKVEVGTAAWIGSLLTGFYLMTGPLVSSLCNQIGFRLTGMIGSCIATVGFILSWFFCIDGEPNMTALFICYGVIGGIGFGLAYMPSIICVGFYFSKKRALATGIAICGSGIGTFVYAPLIEYLIIKWEWQGSLLFQAGLIFLCTGFAALYKPLEPLNRDDEDYNSVPRTPYQTPVGTPLLLRIKRARELEKWDSVNSFSSMEGGIDGNRRSLTNPLLVNGATTTSMDETKSKAELLYENARKASANSLPGVQAIALKPKKLSVPTMVVGDGSGGQQQQIPQRTASIKNKSFVGLPVGLKEIVEDVEMTNDENGVDKKDTEGSNQPVPTRRSLYLRRNSTVSGAVGGNDSGPNLAAGRRSSGAMTLVLSSSALQGGGGGGGGTEMSQSQSQSRILRVATSKTTLNKPLLRDDIFYSGSLSRIPEYANNADAVFSSVEWETPMQRAISTSIIGIPLEAAVKKSRFLVLKKMLDFSLLKSPTFLILAISGAITMLGFFVPFIYCKAIAVDSDYMDPKSATFLISIIGISNTIARIFCGALADRSFVNPLIINNVALTVGGVATFCVPFLNSNALFIIYACVFGISVACFASLRSILLVELLGLSKLTNAFGLLLLFQGAAALVGSPLAGFLKVATGKYEATFYVAGSMMVLSGVMCYPIHYINTWEKKREERLELLKTLS